MQIDSVPQEIARESYLDLIRGAGFDVNHLRSLRFATDGIYAEVFATDADGHKIIDSTTGEPEPVVHTVFVKAVP